MDIVYFHANCQDGWAAAFAAKLKYPEAELHPLNYGTEGQFERVLRQSLGKDVMMVDFSFKKRKENDTLNAAAHSLIILDHHKSQEAVLAGCPYAIFDNERSGAGMTWDYLYGGPNPKLGTYLYVPRPWWVNYTEDQDLWRFKLPHSKEVNAYLRAQDYSIPAWRTIMADTSEVQASHLGQAIRMFVDKLNQEILAETMEGVLVWEGRNYRTAVVNTKVISEPGAILANDGYDVALGWFERHDDLIQFGLRSRQPGPVDVGAICKNFHGGGGHKHAGGFEMGIREGRELIDGILGRRHVASCC